MRIRQADPNTTANYADPNTTANYSELQRTTANYGELQRQFEHEVGSSGAASD
jgi:hypothetical protein